MEALFRHWPSAAFFVATFTSQVWIADGATSANLITAVNPTFIYVNTVSSVTLTGTFETGDKFATVFIGTNCASVTPASIVPDGDYSTLTVTGYNVPSTGTLKFCYRANNETDSVEQTGVTFDVIPATTTITTTTNTTTTTLTTTVTTALTTALTTILTTHVHVHVTTTLTTTVTTSACNHFCGGLAATYTWPAACSTYAALCSACSECSAMATTTATTQEIRPQDELQAWLEQLRAKIKGITTTTTSTTFTTSTTITTTAQTCTFPLPTPEEGVAPVVGGFKKVSGYGCEYSGNAFLSLDLAVHACKSFADCGAVYQMFCDASTPGEVFQLCRGGAWLNATGDCMYMRW